MGAQGASVTEKNAAMMRVLQFIGGEKSANHKKCYVGLSIFQKWIYELKTKMSQTYAALRYLQ